MIQAILDKLGNNKFIELNNECTYIKVDNAVTKDGLEGVIIKGKLIDIGADDGRIYYDLYTNSQDIISHPEQFNVISQEKYEKVLSNIYQRML